MPEIFSLINHSENREQNSRCTSHVLYHTRSHRDACTTARRRPHPERGLGAEHDGDLEEVAPHGQHAQRAALQRRRELRRGARLCEQG